MRDLASPASCLCVVGLGLEDEPPSLLPRAKGDFCSLFACGVNQLPGALCRHIAQVIGPRTGLLSKIANTVKRRMVGQVLSAFPDLANHVHHFAGGGSQVRRILFQC